MPISQRAYSQRCEANFWKEIWEASEYFTKLSHALENAERYAVLVGWQIDSRLPMPRPQVGLQMHLQESLRDKVIRLCEQKPQLNIYFLIWDHAYFYTLEREWWQGSRWEGLHPRAHFVFDNRHALGGSHHEKLCLIDGKIAFCGGIDLCDARWDSRRHRFRDPRRSLSGALENHGPYHDLAVEVSGPICREIYWHISRRWRRISTIPFPPPGELLPASADSRSVYLSRTLAHIEDRSTCPITREVEFLFRDLIGEARHKIIFEGQYYWSKK